MRYAVQMLLMDNKNITQVAQLCGYSSTSYFISVLRRFTAWHRWIISPNSDKSDVVKGKAETDKTGINEEEMARPAGFEPAAHDLEGRCSINWAKGALIPQCGVIAWIIRSTLAESMAFDLVAEQVNDRVWFSDLFRYSGKQTHTAARLNQENPYFHVSKYNFPT